VAEEPCCFGDKNNVLAPFGRELLWQFPQLSFVSVHYGPSLIFHISFKYIQVWGSYNGKTLLRPFIANAVQDYDSHLIGY